MRRLLLLFFLLLVPCMLADAQTYDWHDVENVFLRRGTVKGDVFKITFPRRDLRVRVDDVMVEPGLALSSWVAIRKTENGAVMMGDLVLLEGETGPVLSKLISNGLEMTDLHNRLLGETPKIMYVHFEGRGKAADLARAIKEVIFVTATPTSLPPAAPPPSPGIDWSKVESTLGLKGHRTGNLLSLNVPRAEPVTEDGMEIPPIMGVATSINFQMVGGDAAASGDFVLVGGEVNPVVRALTENGIAVTAVHNHMLVESPRLFFIHFWGYGNPEKLAQGLKAALDKTNSRARR